MGRRGDSLRALSPQQRFARFVQGLRARLLQIGVVLACLVIGSNGLQHFGMAHADDAWALDRDGIWDDPANWLNGTVPDGVGVRVLFGPVTTAARAITVQDLPNGQGNDDGVITVGELTFDSPFSYTLVGNQLLEFDSFDGLVRVRVLSRANQAAHALGSGLDALRLVARDDIVFDIQSPAGLNIWKELTTTGVTATKTGHGPLTVRAATDATWIVEEGTLKVLGAPIVTVNGGALDALQAQNPVTIIGPKGGGILSGTYSTENRLRGEGVLYKTGIRTLNIQALQPGFSGAIVVREGDLNLSVPATNPLPDVPSIDVEDGARLVLGKHDYRRMFIEVGSGAGLMGSTEGGLGFGSLVRGGNLTLGEDAIIFHDGATESIGNLGTAGDVWFGIGAAPKQPVNLTVGDGTPWKGMVVDALMPNGGTIVANSDFSIRGGFPIGDTSDGDRGLNIVSSGPRRTVTITNASLYSDDADLSGVGRLAVSGQLRVHGPGTMGPGPRQVPIIELLRGSGLTAVTSTPSPAQEVGHLGIGAEAATIHVRGRTSISLQGNTSGNVNFGGNFVVETPESVSIFASGGATRNRDPAQLQIQSLHVTADAQISLGSVDNKQPVIVGETNLGSHDVRIITAGTGSPNVAALQGPLIGNGTLRIFNINRAITRLDGDLSEFRGPNSRVVVETGMLRLGDDRAFDVEDGGLTIQSQNRRLPGVLSYSADVDLGRKLSPDSAGELALRGRHTALSGVSGSYAFIGADGVATIVRPGLQAGAERTYRLGSTTASAILSLDAGPTSAVLTGDNHVVIDYSGAAFQSAAFQNSVEFLCPNDYTGSTTIKRGTLVLRAREAIGHGVVAGPINVELGSLEIRDEGTVGTTGPITINGALRLFSDGEKEIDRVPEETPIVLRGGMLAFNGVGTAGKPRERIGAVAIAERHSTIAITGQEAGARLEIASLSRNSHATVGFDGLSRALGQGEDFKEEIYVGNGNALLANRIIPWAVAQPRPMHSIDFVTYGPGGLAKYSGPVAAEINGAGPTDNVRIVSDPAPLSENRTINSLQLESANTIDTRDHVLNIGTAPDGVAMGAIVGRGTIGTAFAPGFLTAGQISFAPNSASRGELIFHHSDNGRLVINAAIIDNAGPDGVFGNTDDLPVAVTAAGNVILNSSANRYSGGTTIHGPSHGSLVAYHQLGPGPVHISGGHMALLPETSGVRMVEGPVVIDGGSIRATAPPPDGATTGQVRIGSLTIAPGSGAAVTGSGLVVEELLDARNARLSVVGNLTFEKAYVDDSKTVYGSSAHGGHFLTARTNDAVEVRATFEGVGLGAQGAGTVISFSGSMDPGDSGALSATDSGRLLIQPSAAIDGPLIITGRPSGVVEFAEGFKSIAGLGPQGTSNSLHTITVAGGVMWSTNHSENLPNIDPALMSDENDYDGLITFGWPGSSWQVDSRSQSFNQRMDIFTSARVITNANLLMAYDSLSSFGAYNVELRDGTRVLRSSSGSIEKFGPADFHVAGRLRTINDNAIDVREGRLVMNNRTAEGTGTLDVRVHDGGKLSGGNAAATAGLIPGMIRVEAGGTLDPGDDDATGVLSIVGDLGALELKPASVFEPTIAGAAAGTLYDRIRVAGTVELGDGGAAGTAVLAPTLNYAPGRGDLYFLIDNDGADPIAGLFQTPAGAVLSEGSFFKLTSSADDLAYRFEIGYRGDTGSNMFSSPTGNDVVFRAVAIPEPASLALLLTFAGLAALGRVALRRDRVLKVSTVCSPAWILLARSSY